jgi:uncharacterized protein GlcG (DUF336 family)
MDGCAPGAVPMVRAKAFGAAVNGEPSSLFAARMAKFGPGVFATYQAVMRDQPFPGAGAMPVRQGGHILGAIATGLGIGPFIKLPGVAPSMFLDNGKPANLEDIIISYALDLPYNAQHGDDMTRWIEAYGTIPDPADNGTAMAEVDLAGRQRLLRRAQRLADYAMAEAARENIAVAVAVIDPAGDIITLDRMDGASPMGVDVAAAVGVTAVNFGMPSREVAADRSDSGGLKRLMDLVPYRMLAIAGGVPFGRESGGGGAVGIHSRNSDYSHELAERAVQWGVLQFEGEN